jgi:hypothetical protein
MKMYNIGLLFLACILAGFALLRLTASGVALLGAGLVSFFEVVAVIVIIIFVFALLFIGFKALFSKSWR